MSQRTTIAAVQAILGADYGQLPDGTYQSLQQFIDTATVVIDRVHTCAINASKTLTTTELELIERWLSAHYYTRSDPTLVSKTGGSFTQPKDNPERYLQTALEIDSSGCLYSILKKQNASAMWLGKTLPERSSYDERN